MASISGTSGNDSLRGTGASDTINGLGGHDRLFGLAGDDSLFGGAGGDTLNGGQGNDALDGGEGSDWVAYDDSPGGVQIDLGGGSAADGWGTSDSIVSVGLAIGSPGNDEITGNDNVNTLRGLGGLDILRGLGGADRLEGGRGNDLLHGGAGADVLDGGDGSDTVNYLDDFGGALTLDLAAGTAAQPGGGDRIISVGHALGTGSADSMAGTDNVNILHGGAGNDTILVRGGDDILSGGPGVDTLDGGEGSDTVTLKHDLFFGDVASNDGFLIATLGARGGGTVDLAAGTALDLVSGETDRLVSIGLAEGSEFADTLLGNDNFNRLTGQGGADTLTGRGGPDEFRFEAPTEGQDTITDFTPGQDHLAVLRGGFGLAQLPAGGLPGDRLASGAPADGNDNFVFDPSTGLLSFDSDGNAGAASQPLATLQGVTALSGGDFLLV